MYKNKIVAACMFFAILMLCFMCFIKFWELDNLKNRRNLLAGEARSMEELVNTIHETSWDELKSKEKIFNQNMNTKGLAERIVKKFLLRKVLFKMHDEVNAREKILEIKFSVSDESRIYDFLDALWRESTGIIGFESIEILRSSSRELFVKIKCKNFFFDEKEAERSIEVIEQKHPVNAKSINLFNLRKQKEHSLLGILNNSKVYVDDTWYGVGDKIDDYRVVSIHQNSIEIQSNNKKSTITLGTSW